MSLRPQDVGWAAGFWQADGTVYLRRVREGPARPTIAASQNSREPLDALSQMFGGNVQPAGRRINGEIRYRWSLQSQEPLRRFILAVYPHVRDETRREKLKLAYAISKVCRVGHQPRPVRRKRQLLAEQWDRRFC